MQNQMEIELPGLKRVQAAATAPVKASQSEIGYAQAVNYNWWLYEEENTPELVWPQSVSVYDQMRRTDAQVNSVLEAVWQPIRRTSWRIDPNGARATVVKFVAGDLGLPIVGKDQKPSSRMKGKFSWSEHLRLALLELVYGHMFFEQVYQVNDAGTEAHLKKLAPRMPKTISRIDVASDGGLVSITQWWTNMNTEPRPIPVDRLVAYVRNREGGNWLGQSILRPAYKNWLIKDRLLRVQAQTVERNGMGIPLYKAQEGASPGDLAAGKDMATAWRAGEAAGSAVPYGADLVLRGVEGTLPDADVPIRYHDEQIARAVLAHFLNLGTQTGSWALGTTFADFFVFSLQSLAQQIADVTTQHVIEDLVDLNFGPDEPAPKLVFDEIGSQQQATAQALKTLVDAGVLHPDEVLEGTTRQQYGLPPADPATATPPPGTPAAAPAEPTPTGALSVAAGRRRRSVRARFDPAEKRDAHGRWAESAAGLVADELDIADRIHLDQGEHLVLSDAFYQRGGDHELNAAIIQGPGGRKIRLGVTHADDSWPGDSTDTVHLEPGQFRKLHADLADAAKEGKKAAADAQKAWNMGTAPTDPRLLGSAAVSKGAASDSDTSLTWDVFVTDDDPASWEMTLGVEGAGELTLDPRAATKLLKFMQGLDAHLGDAGVQAAAGVDAHPGGEQLKHYWVYGEGAAKWTTWTELYHHLRSGKDLTDEQAKRIAASWFHLRYGYWPGDHRNLHAAGAAPADDEADEWEEQISALVVALAELSSGVQAASFDPAKHPRGTGGRFRSTVDKLKSAIETHRSGGGKGDPFEGFDREQLRRAAKTRGIALGRGEDRDSIARKLLDDLGGAPATPDTAPKRQRKSPARPKVPAGKPGGRSGRGSVGGGRDITADVIRDVAANGDRNRYDALQAEFGQYDVRDGVLTELAREQGYGLPAVGSVDQAVNSGGIELFRGVRASEGGITSAEQFAAMRDDPDFALGSGIYGNGIYFSVDRGVANAFAGLDSPAPTDPGAAHFGGPGETVRVAIRPDARIVTLKQLEAERKKWLRAQHGDIPPEVENWLFDNGRFAAMRGYDAVRIDNLDDGHTIREPGRRPRQSRATQYLVLNRGALTMEAG